VTTPRFGVWAPVYGNHGARNHPADAPDASYRRNRNLIVRAEQAGFDATLVAQHVLHPSNTEDDVLETWSTLAALAEATSRIELIGAIKPLPINPLVFAKIAGNIADISRGRLSINLVSGWFLPELEALGLQVPDHDD
jgi:alkanesulfonate monooxygenase